MHLKVAFPRSLGLYFSPLDTDFIENKQFPNALTSYFNNIGDLQQNWKVSNQINDGNSTYDNTLN